MKSTKIMVVGGCFDILHPGHMDFLKKARSKCDYLIVILEPDEKVRMIKGVGRPKTNLEFRIKNLEKTGFIDEVITLPVLKTNMEYQQTISKIMAKWLNNHRIFYFGITKNDRNVIKNEKIRALGKKIGIEVVEVNELIPKWSTSTILSSLPRNKYLE